MATFDHCVAMERLNLQLQLLAAGQSLTTGRSSTADTTPTPPPLSQRGRRASRDLKPTSLSARGDLFVIEALADLHETRQQQARETHDTRDPRGRAWFSAASSRRSSLAAASSRRSSIGSATSRRPSIAGSSRPSSLGSTGRVSHCSNRCNSSLRSTGLDSQSSSRSGMSALEARVQQVMESDPALVPAPLRCQEIGEDAFFATDRLGGRDVKPSCGQAATVREVARSLLRSRRGSKEAQELKAHLATLFPTGQAGDEFELPALTARTREPSPLSRSHDVADPVTAPVPMPPVTPPKTPGRRPQRSMTCRE